MKLVFATQNENKLQEVQAMMPEGITLISLNALGHTEELEETRETLEGNAHQKAQFVYDKYQLPCFADDTGLEIDALNGEPGVYSARYASERKDAGENMDKVLEKLKGVYNRQAQFRTSICLVLNGEAHYYNGIVVGEILTEKRGGKGFGYDPIFQPDGFSKSFAEMSADDKNAISHRGRAIRALIEGLKGLM